MNHSFYLAVDGLAANPFDKHENSASAVKRGDRQDVERSKAYADKPRHLQKIFEPVGNVSGRNGNGCDRSADGIDAELAGKELTERL